MSAFAVNRATEDNTRGSVDEAIARVVREEIAKISLRRKQVLDIDEAAEYLGVSVNQVHNFIADGKLTPVRYDRRLRFDIDDLNRLIHESKRRS
ncbi:MAG TPA: helix-turn-helix domain-containing protein [Bryobacteraceae bacterium]|jgi:excisionase family DNA binding protein|nr:helix-turn-helix domain-containing protein [Bryobacteraceae bacterium]